MNEKDPYSYTPTTQVQNHLVGQWLSGIQYYGTVQLSMTENNIEMTPKEKESKCQNLKRGFFVTSHC